MKRISQKRIFYRRRLTGLSFLVFILFFTVCSPKEVHIETARKFIKKWNYDRALTEIIAYRGHQDAEVQYLLGYCYLRKNENDQAFDYFTRSLQIGSEFRDSIIDIYNVLARNALRIKEAERALTFYHTLAHLIPDYDQADNFFIVGDLNYETGNFPAALTAYAQALRVDSLSKRSKTTKYRYIKCLKECDSLELALPMAAEQYENLKTSANLLLLNEVRYALGERALESGFLDSATVFFEEIIALREPKSLLDGSYYYLGEINYRRGNYEVALEMYKKVLRLNPYEKGEFVRKSKERIHEIKEM